MEKTPLREEEIKELEDEIDLAVDRLFVEKRKGVKEAAPKEPPGYKPSLQPAFELSDLPSPEPSFGAPGEPEKEFDFEQSFAPPPPPPPAPSSYLKSIDQLEAQLLALEWEITEEKLHKTQEAVHSLNHLLKQRSDIGSILGFMDDVLSRMTTDAEKIRPPMIKFLLDGKETIKLLLRRETEGEVSIYKQLALEGMEARFAGLQEGEDVRGQAPPLPVEKDGPRHPNVEWEKVEEMFGQWRMFFGRAGETLREMEQRLSRWEKVRSEPPVSPATAERPPVDVTVFRASGKCYGVESQKIWKLFRVPPSFREKYGRQPRIRLRDRDVSLIDLQKIFPEATPHAEGAAKLLMLEGEGEYKGLLVEEVLKRLRGHVEEQREEGKPVLGILRWIDRSQPLEVPILDFKRI